MEEKEGGGGGGGCVILTKGGGGRGGKAFKKQETDSSSQPFIPPITQHENWQNLLRRLSLLQMDRSDVSLAIKVVTVAPTTTGIGKTHSWLLKRA